MFAIEEKTSSAVCPKCGSSGAYWNGWCRKAKDYDVRKVFCRSCGNKTIRFAKGTAPPPAKIARNNRLHEERTEMVVIHGFQLEFTPSEYRRYMEVKEKKWYKRQF